jgi:hypothetical protein
MAYSPVHQEDEMNTDSASTTDFVKTYIAAWSTKDSATRQELVVKVYANDAAFFADEPGDGPVKHIGIADITANISRVNERLVQDKGLFTESTGHAVNHDALKVSWRMMTPDRTVAMTGMNLLLRDMTGKILQDYIFIG